MGDSGKRFGWTEDGLDAKDRIQKNDLKPTYKKFKGKSTRR